MADQARQIFRDCVSDISELSTCRDCYRYANTRGDKHWFAKPCRPFHEIVYAKQKSFPYWPAKVLTGQENSEGQLEVRFFGGFHQRAVVEKHHIKPITTNIHTLQVRTTYSLAIPPPLLSSYMMELKMTAFLSDKANQCLEQSFRGTEEIRGVAGEVQK